MMLVESPEQAEIQQVGTRFVESEGKDPSGLLLIGTIGSGKTHYACALINELLKRRRSPLYYTAIDLVRNIRASWHSGSEETEEQAVRRLILADLLVVDELGIQAGTPSEQALLMNVVDGRYAQLRPTILIGNVTIHEMTNLLGERVIDRFKQGGRVLVFDWPSRREHMRPDPDEYEAPVVHRVRVT